MSAQSLSQAETYRNQMFQLAGEGDPSVAMREMPAQVRAIVESAGDLLRVRPAQGEWSVIELVGHLLDDELVVSVRLRRTLIESDVTLPGFDQDLWVAAQHYSDADPELLLAALTALRPLTVATWEQASAAQRQQMGLHGERGPESAETVYRMLAGHDRFHLAQMRDTLDTLRNT